MYQESNKRTVSFYYSLYVVLDSEINVVSETLFPSLLRKSTHNKRVFEIALNPRTLQSCDTSSGHQKGIPVTSFPNGTHCARESRGHGKATRSSGPSLVLPGLLQFPPGPFHGALISVQMVRGGIEKFTCLSLPVSLPPPTSANHILGPLGHGQAVCTGRASAFTELCTQEQEGLQL